MAIYIRQVTRTKSKSSAVVEHQRVLVVLKTTSIAKQLFKSGAAPLYRSLVTSLYMYIPLITVWQFLSPWVQQSVSYSCIMHTIV